MTPAQTPPVASALAGPILALDYGRRRIGAAVSGELGISIRTLAVIQRKNREQALREIAGIVRRESIRLIVVGSPLHLSGAEGEMAVEAKRFAARLKKRLGLSVELQDERLTTWEAAQVSRDNASMKKNRASSGAGRLDSVAAAIILRDFLNARAAERKAG